jgi:iron complex transport system substrate-binding protein
VKLSRCLVFVAVASLVALSGCTATPAPSASPTLVPSALYPVTIDNCGFELTVTSSPKRVVTIKSTSTELLLALGLGDRIIGQAFADGPLPAELDALDHDIEVISDFAPSQEAVLTLEPDFIVAGWESNFTPDTAGDRVELSTLGIGSYVSPAACKEPEYKPARLSFENVFDYITETGDIFGVPDAAAALVSSQRATLTSIEVSHDDLTALWWSSGEDTPYVGAGIGAPQLVLETAGLTNIAADIDDTWTSLSWEAIIDANPDVIVLIDASWNTAESKIAALEGNPATASMTAVVNQSYIVIPFAAGEAGVRTVEAVSSVAEQLAALR